MKKILKKLSIIDFLLLISVLMAFAFFYFFYSKETVTVYVSTTNSFLDWTEDPMPPYYWLSNQFKVGDKAYHTSGGEVAEIISVNNSEWGGQRRFSKLGLKVQALYNIRSKTYLVRDQPILIGKELELNFNGVNYKGVVTYIGKEPEDLSKLKKHLKVELYIPDLYPWMAQLYNKDFVVKNTDGEEMFKILSSKISPTERNVTTADGRLLRRMDPYFKDVNIIAELVATCEQGVCYFNDSDVIRIGGHMRVHSEKLLIEEKSVIKNFEILDGK